MHGKWLVVANRVSARLFVVRERGKSLSLVESLEHPAGRLHGRALESDRPGRVFDSHGEGRHALGSAVGASAQVAETFAHQVAKRLRAARNDHAYDELVLVAEPRFLGLLRRALDSATSAAVVASLDKDLAAFDAAELVSHLAEVLKPQTLG